MSTTNDNILRILHILPEVSGGGGMQSPIQFAIKANRLGYQVHHCLVLEGDPADYAASLPDKLQFLSKPKKPTLNNIAHMVAESGYDIIHWHWWKRIDSMTRFMAKMACYGGHRRIITCDVYPAAPEYILGKREIEYADLIVFDGINAMQASTHVPESKKVFVVGSCDLTAYHQQRTRPEDGVFRIGRGSLLSPHKCPHDLIDQIAPILSAIPHAEFHIFGQGLLEKRFRRDILRHGLENRVLMRGWVHNFAEEVTNLDLYLYHMPRNCYGSSELNLQGAMAAGLPIVVVPSPGVRWMFTNGQDSIIADTPMAAIDHSIRLAFDPAERVRLAANARITACNLFGLENMVDGYSNKVYAACKMRYPDRVTISTNPEIELSMRELIQMFYRTCRKKVASVYNAIKQVIKRLN